jgi:hypothetical protein
MDILELVAEDELVYRLQTAEDRKRQFFHVIRVRLSTTQMELLGTLLARQKETASQIERLVEAFQINDDGSYFNK